MFVLLLFIYKLIIESGSELSKRGAERQNKRPNEQQLFEVAHDLFLSFGGNVHQTPF